MLELNRRLFIAGLGATTFGGMAEAAPGTAPFSMWHSPGCGCCLEWGRRMEAAFKRKLQVVKTADIAAIKKARGVPDDLQSCHTALIGNVVVEGHVPPADIQRLIGTGNRRGLGLAVPGMPAGSPGMDVGHSRRDAYTVYAFERSGRRFSFARHG